MKQLDLFGEDKTLTRVLTKAEDEDRQRFLTLLHREPTDYVEISRRLYEGQTIEEIFERARNQWKG